MGVEEIREGGYVRGLNVGEWRRAPNMKYKGQ